MFRLADPLVRVELVELDIDADQIAAFARDEQDAALAGGLDQRLQADIGEVGDGKDIHHAPGLIGRIPAQRAPERLAHGAARAVAADDIARLDRFDLPLVRGIDPLQRDRHRDGTRRRRRMSISRSSEAAGVMRLQPARRIAHDVEVEIMHARLVEDDVRKLRQPVFDILHPADGERSCPCALSSGFQNVVSLTQ